MLSPPEELVTRLAQRHAIAAAETWVPLTGGQTNRSWRAKVNGAVCAIKLYAEANDNPLFPNSARDEAELLRFLDPTGLAPPLVDELATPHGPCLIYTYQDGEVWNADPAPIASAISLLHGQDVTALPLRLRRMDGGSASLGAQTETIIARLPGSDQRRLHDLRPEKPVEASGKTALLHCDLVPGNVIVDGTRISLIDWQCPAIGDPVEDLLIFLSPAMQQIYRGRPLSETEKAAFLDAYNDPDIRDRIATLAPWHHWRMAAYCTWKAVQGCAEYEAAGALEIAALLA